MKKVIWLLFKGILLILSNQSTVVGLQSWSTPNTSALGEWAGDPSATESIHAALALADDHAGLSHARRSGQPTPPFCKVFLTFAWVRTSLPLEWKSHKWRIEKAKDLMNFCIFYDLRGIRAWWWLSYGAKELPPTERKCPQLCSFLIGATLPPGCGQRQAVHRLTTHLIGESTS